MLWGILIGGAPLYFGIERLVTLDQWLPLAWQLACLVGAALAVGLAIASPARLFPEGRYERVDDRHVHHGGRRSTGRWLFHRGAEIVSLIVGGIGFLFGAMWFGAGIQQLRDK